MNIISSFQGEYRFLSNFWPCTIPYNGLIYPSTEHAYQSAKVNDLAIKTRIRDCNTPVEAKDFFTTYNIPPDPGWQPEKKLEVMEELLSIKFGSGEPLLTRALLATKDAELIEGNTWNDTFWGVYDGKGENHLGRLLMKVRQSLFQQKKEILKMIASGLDNEEIASKLKVNQRTLYERMLAFSISNKDFWIL